MKRLIPLLCLVAAQTYATTIPIDLGPPTVINGDRKIAFDTLNGTLLEGQAMSIDFSFGLTVKLFDTTSRSFDFLFLFETQAGRVYARGESGFLTNNGIAVTRTWAANNFIFGGYVFPFFADSSGTPIPGHLFFNGAHFDLTAPDRPGLTIAGGELLLIPNASKPWNAIWAVGKVPEAGQTWVLMALGFLATLSYKRLQNNSAIREFGGIA